MEKMLGISLLVVYIVLMVVVILGPAKVQKSLGLLLTGSSGPQPSNLIFAQSGYFNSIIQFWLFYGRSFAESQSLLTGHNGNPIPFKLYFIPHDSDGNPLQAPNWSENILAQYGFNIMGLANGGKGTGGLQYLGIKGSPTARDGKWDTPLYVLPDPFYEIPSWKKSVENAFLAKTDNIVLDWASAVQTPIFQDVFQTFIKDKYVLPKVDDPDVQKNIKDGHILPTMIDILKNYGGQNVSDIYKYMCCYVESRTMMDPNLRRNLCDAGSYNVDGGIVPSQQCVNFMENVWCKNPTKEQLECGCYDSYPLNADDVTTLIYDQYKGQLPRKCIVPSCSSGVAFKDASATQATCPSVCASFIKIEGDKYSTIDLKDVTIQMSCGENGISLKSCASDKDCAQGYMCNPSSKLCEKPLKTPPECIQDKDCKDGYVCKEGKCVQPPGPPMDCVKDQDCKDGYVCKEGKCVQPPPGPPPVECQSDKDCKDGYKCMSGKCEKLPPPPPECTQNKDCASNFECSNGKCVKKSSFFEKYKIIILSSLGAIFMVLFIIVMWLKYGKK